jgi:hypothetical protein
VELKLEKRWQCRLEPLLSYPARAIGFDLRYQSNLKTMKSNTFYGGEGGFEPTIPLQVCRISSALKFAFGSDPKEFPLRRYLNVDSGTKENILRTSKH